jgi:type IV fimbrial biogenesis protein FimT
MLSKSSGLRQYGVTLIEAMIVVAILGLMIAMAGPAVGDWLKNSQIRTAGEALLDGIQQARNEAVRRNVAVEFRLLAGTSWEVRLADTTVSDRLLATRTSADGSKDVVLTPSPANATIIAFDGMGRRMTSNVDGSSVLLGACVDLPSTVLAPAKTRDLQLNIALSGQIRMCDPKVSASDSRYCTEPLIAPCGT